VKKPLPGEQFKKTELPLDDAAFRDEFPNLYDHLFATTYEDGSGRMTSTMLIFSENGVLKLCLNDRDNGRSVFITATEFLSLFSVIETGLASNSLDWRSRRQSGDNGNKVPW